VSQTCCTCSSNGVSNDLIVLGIKPTVADITEYGPLFVAVIGVFHPKFCSSKPRLEVSLFSIKDSVFP
jgi:hypothetical protein